MEFGLQVRLSIPSHVNKARKHYICGIEELSESEFVYEDQDCFAVGVGKQDKQLLNTIF